MKNARFLFCLLLLLAGTFISSALPAAEEGTMSLFIRNQHSGAGIPAVVKLQGPEGLQMIETGPGGRLDFSGAPGKYLLQISSPGCQAMESYFFVEAGRILNIDFWLEALQPYVPPQAKKGSSIIEGYVVDRKTGMVVPGIEVYNKLAGISVQTDKQGFFRLESPAVSDMQNSSDKPVLTDLQFSGQGFGTYTIHNYLVLPGIFTLPVTLEEGSAGITENFRQSILEKGRGISPEQISAADENRAAILSPQGCPALSANIRVGTSCSCTTCSSVSVMTLENYVGSGLDDEWIASWLANSLKAGAVAYRTYGAYYVAHPVNANFDIASTTCNQAWGAATAASCISAASATAGEVLTNGQGGPLAKSEYAAEQNKHPSCGDSKTGDGTAAWPCQADAVCAGSAYNGHGRGMCQWGSQRWAQNSQVYTWILDHYYNNGKEYRCNLSTDINENLQPAPGMIVSPNPGNGLFNFSGSPGGFNVAVFDVCGRMIANNSFAGEAGQIDLTFAGKGLYLYIITRTPGLVKGKLIVQ